MLFGCGAERADVCAAVVAAENQQQHVFVVDVFVIAICNGGEQQQQR